MKKLKYWLSIVFAIAFAVSYLVYVNVTIREYERPMVTASDTTGYMVCEDGEVVFKPEVK